MKKEVETFAKISGKDVQFILISPDAADLMEDVKLHAIDEQLEKIREIRERIVPLYEELDDWAVDYPWLEEEELVEVLRCGTEAMGGEVEEAFRFMDHYELFDVSLSDSKAGKSFQSYLNDYNAPYVFVNPYGDDSDILTFAHEFGHFLANGFDIVETR